MHRILLTLIDLVANLLLGQDTLIWIFGIQIRDQALQLLTKGGNGGLLAGGVAAVCLLYTSPSPRDGLLSRMPSSA